MCCRNRTTSQGVISLLLWSLLSSLIVAFSLPRGAESRRPDKEASSPRVPATAEESFRENPSVRDEGDRGPLAGASPANGETSPSLEETGPHLFVATAYCLPGQTASGAPVGPGVIAADPDVLPLGSIVRLSAGRYSGTYTVLDTGAKVRGRMVDIWMPSEDEARRFGVRRVRLHVLRHGWKKIARRQRSPLPTTPSDGVGQTGSR